MRAQRPFDAGVFIASCDKAVPAHLMAIGRLNIPSIVVTGGVMDAGPELLTLEQLGTYSAMQKRGEISEKQLDYYKQHACPSCGACSFRGTASTMQIMAEALGLMLPGSALMPAMCTDLYDVSVRAGRQAVRLAEQNLLPRDIVTRESFENAILVHAAVSGSTNALLHIPAIAHEFGIELDADTFDRLHRGAHYLLDVRPAGRWPAAVRLLCWRCAAHYGGNQTHAPPRRNDRNGKNAGREPRRTQEKQLLRSL